MKKIVYILFGIFTFSVGFWLFNLYPFSDPISLCEISQHIELYQSKQIRIKAYLYAAGFAEDNRSFYYVSDFENDCYTTASLEISEKLKRSIEDSKDFENFSELKQSNNKLLEEDNGKGIYVIEVEITGNIKKTVYNSETTGFAVAHFPFEIEAEEIKQVTPIRFVSQEEIENFQNFKKKNDFIENDIN